MTTKLHKNKGIYRGLPNALAMAEGTHSFAGKRERVPQATGHELGGEGCEGPRTIYIGQNGSGRVRRIEARSSACRAERSPPEVAFVACDGTVGVLRLRRGQYCFVLDGVGLPDCDELPRLFDLAAGVRILACLSREADEEDVY